MPAPKPPEFRRRAVELARLGIDPLMVGRNPGRRRCAMASCCPNATQAGAKRGPEGGVR
jgi:hypothetical protein